LNQGSDFFHDVISLGVSYFLVTETASTPVDRLWHGRQPEKSPMDSLRHLQLPMLLTVAVDERTKRGSVKHD